MTSLVFLSLAALGASSFIAPGPLAFERGVGIPSTPIGSRGFTPVDHWRSIRQACSSPCFGGCCNSGGPCCPWMACCPVGYVCAPINGKNGCCPEGQNCTTIAPNACQQPGYVQCSGANLCCPQGAVCTTDATGAPACNLTGVSNSGTTSPTSTLIPASLPASTPAAPTTPPAAPTTASPPPAATPSNAGSGGSSGNASAKTQASLAVVGVIAMGIAVLL